MQNPSIQDGLEEHPMVRVVRCLADTLPSEFRDVLDTLARAGDTEAVRALLDAGLLDERPAKSAVLTLPLHAKDPEAAADLVRKVISDNGCPTAQEMAMQFKNARSAQAVQALVVLGGDPNWLDTSEVPVAITPLARQISKAESTSKVERYQLAPVMAILDVLLERGVVPLMERFQHEGVVTSGDFFWAAAKSAAQDGMNSVYPMVINELIQKDWPDSWRKAMGAAIAEAARLDDKSWDAPRQLTLMAELMSKAKFDDAAAWLELFVNPSNPEALVALMPRWFSDKGFCGAAGVAVVENMIAHGVSIDDIVIDLHSDTDYENVTGRGTLLHGALIMQNEAMVEALLNGGASPDAVVQAHPGNPGNSDVGLSAIALAQAHFPDAVPMLHAKRARDAVARVLEQASPTATTSNPGGAR